MEPMLLDDTLAFSNYYNDDYLTTNTRRGVTQNRAGTRLLALSSDFLMGLHTALAQECGEAAGLVFATCGKHWGRQFGVKFERELTEFYGRPLRELPMMHFEACLVEAFARHGWGLVSVDYSRQERGLIVVDLDHAIYAELLGKSAEMADPLMSGLLAGFFSHLAGQELGAVQTQCPTQGHATSRYVLTLASRVEAAEAMVRTGKTHDEVLAALEQTRAGV